VKINEELLDNILLKVNKILDNNLKRFDFDINVKNTPAFVFHNKKLKPVNNFSKQNIKELIGIEYQKKEVIKNTEKFLQGKPANNVLLWGERGTGKSSLIKSLIPLFRNRGLRLIQVLKEDILDILELYEFIHKNIDYRFIIFIDDLSFEETEKEFKEFKTIIDGAIFEIPDNLLFYITSNRKNLIPIKFSDRQKEETRISDVLEEKLSLVDRFGLRLGFYPMDKKTYLSIVEFYANKYSINLEKEKLYNLAMRYSREMGIMNGRVALQFVKSL